jgi:hypothetical protein
MAEAVGTAFLLIAVVGSGIAVEQLAGRNMAIALLANSLAGVAAPDRGSACQRALDHLSLRR